MSGSEEKMFQVSSSPHLRDHDSIPKIMWTVNIALIPALVMATYFFGYKAIWITALAVIAAVVTEGIIQKLVKRFNKYFTRK